MTDAPNVRYDAADAEQLPYDDGSFDLVTLGNMIPFFDELARVVAPGGRVLFAFSAGPETPIYVSSERLRDELGRRGFAEFAELSAGRGTALLAEPSVNVRPHGTFTERSHRPGRPESGRRDPPRPMLGCIERPTRLDRLPEQYFMSLLARVRATAALDGEPLVDLGRGNPDIPPPAHVIEALVDSAREQTSAVHGYAPFAGLPELREAIAARYADVYGVTLDPEREVAVVPGTKTALTELVLALAERGDTVLLPDPYYPDYPSGIALVGAKRGVSPLDPNAVMRRASTSRRARTSLRCLPQLPVQPDRSCSRRRRLCRRNCVRAGNWRRRHPRLRVRRSRLRRPQAGELPRGRRRARGRLRALLDVEDLRDGLAARLRRRQRGDRRRASRCSRSTCAPGSSSRCKAPAIAALTGPQETVAERRDLYQRRRDRVLAAVGELARRAKERSTSGSVCRTD